MQPDFSILEQLSVDERRSLISKATRSSVEKGKRIFSTGDEADYIYFIESGSVSVQLDQFNTQAEIDVIGAGCFFGEMAILNNTKRTATIIAAEDCDLLKLDKQSFTDFLQQNPEIIQKINEIQTYRSHELALCETVTYGSGIDKNRIQISIKGDPSLRETAFMRERYQSIVDKTITEVIPVVESLLIDRCVFRIYMGLHNGEMHLSSVFNPFFEEIHPVNKIVDEAYLDRHFARIPFDRKVEMIRRTYALIDSDVELDKLSPHLKNLFHQTISQWKPVTPDEVRSILDNLPRLRTIPNFYIRALSISMMHDSIRMQFNCDGTHIIRNRDYEKFLNDNVEICDV